MLDGLLHTLLNKLCNGPAPGASGRPPDRELLERFVAGRDEAAFAELVRRHGPAVLGVCRRVLGQEQDAEDAFQATFLVLARQVGSIRKHASVAAWLHGVACRVAASLKREGVRRRDRERVRREVPPPAMADEVSRREVRSVLDEELLRLPQRYRAALVLCYLQGKTQREAARELGLRPTTLKGRLERGRELLRARLARRGLALPAAPLAAALTESAAPAAPPPALAGATVKAGLLVAAGVAAEEVVPGRVAALALGVLKPVFVSGARASLALVLLFGLSLTGAAVLAGHFFGHRPGEAPRPAVPDQGAQKARGREAGPGAGGTRRLTDAHGDMLPAGARLRLGTVRLRHAGGVASLAFAPDGKALVSTGDNLDRSIRLWDLASGKELRRLADGAFVSRVVVSADGKAFASVTEQGLLVWDLATGKEVRRLPVPQGYFRALALAPDGKRLAVCLGDNLILLLDAQTGKEQRQFCHDGLVVTALTFAPDGRTLASGSHGKAVRLWEVATGRVRQEMTVGDNGVKDLLFTPSGGALVVLSDRDSPPVSLLDSATGKELRRLGEKTYVSAMALSPDGKLLAGASWRDGYAVVLWEAATGKEVRRLTGLHGQVTALAFSADGRRLAAGGGGVESPRVPAWEWSSGTSIRVWDVASGKEVSPRGGHEEGVLSVAYSPDGKLLATAGRDNTVRLWDAATGRERSSLVGHRERVSVVRFSPDGGTLASGGSDGTVRLWDVATGQERRRFEGLKYVAKCLAFSPDGKLLAGPGLRLWDVATGKLRRQLPVGKEPPHCLAFSPDGKVLASGGGQMVYLPAMGADNNIHLWDVATGKELRQLKGHRLGVTSLAFSPDGRQLASGGRGTTVRIWEVANGRERRRFEVNSDGEVAFAPDGKAVASSTTHRSVITLWDAATGQARRELAGHQAGVFALAFRPDGGALASASQDGTVLVWDLAGRPAGE
jgi:RNA polymerase sigma factor (sigma-70 family)